MHSKTKFKISKTDKQTKKETLFMSSQVPAKKYLDIQTGGESGIILAVKVTKKNCHHIWKTFLKP